MSMSDQIKTAVVIVAAGRGERAGVIDGPKQYQMLRTKSVLAHAVQPFLTHESIGKIIVVIHQDDTALFAAALPNHPKLLPPVTGGATRQQSVLAGLNALKEHSPQNVLIHDAARPFVNGAVISRVVNRLSQSKAVLPALAVTDTLKRGNENGIVSETVPREKLYAAQTPQGFDFDGIHAAHQKAEIENLTHFTDDSALAEWAGMAVQLVEGASQNSKITTGEDMQEARAKMSNGIPDIRVGHGYDTHQFTDGSSIWLCGVELPHDKSLRGHSDADVGLHALTDALLATISAGDIGSHFPPTDKKWQGAKSDQFLKHAVDLVQKAGGIITHMDVTLLCEAPKIGPHRDEMRSTISNISKVDVARISIKATTNERMGFIGREEGMVALATATVVMGTL